WNNLEIPSSLFLLVPLSLNSYKNCIICQIISLSSDGISIPPVTYVLLSISLSAIVKQFNNVP
ncbi:MAG: hypothetical protein SCK70_08605, partial [bacterium]|nr:hypothetical protein [bacterium]